MRFARRLAMSATVTARARRRLMCLLAAAVLAALVGVPIAAAATAALPGAHPARSSAGARVERALIGTWRLVSAEIRDKAGKLVTRPYGRTPAGRLTYTRSRNVWALVGQRRSKELVNAIWYTGTFRVRSNSRTVVHHVQWASVPEWIGTDLVRRYRLKGSRLTLTVALAAGLGRAPQDFVLGWQRVDADAAPRS